MADATHRPISPVPYTRASTSTWAQLCPPGPCTYLWKTPHCECWFHFYCVCNHTFFCEHLVGLRTALKHKYRKAKAVSKVGKFAVWNVILEHYQNQADSKSYIKVEKARCGCCNTAVVRYLPPFEGAQSMQHKNILLATHPTSSLSLWQQLCGNTRTSREGAQEKLFQHECKTLRSKFSLSLKKKIWFRQAVKPHITFYPCKVLPWQELVVDTALLSGGLQHMKDPQGDGTFLMT